MHQAAKARPTVRPTTTATTVMTKKFEPFDRSWPVVSYGADPRAKELPQAAHSSGLKTKGTVFSARSAGKTWATGLGFGLLNSPCLLVHEPRCKRVGPKL